MRWFFFLYLSLVSILQGEIFKDTGNPEIVHYVNVITGELELSFQDIVAEGALCTSLRRSYSSRGAHNTKLAEWMQIIRRQGWILGSGWQMASHTTLFITPAEHRTNFQASLEGVVYQYSHETNKQLIYLIPNRSYSKASGQLSVRTNPQNNVLRLNLAKGEATLFLPDGGERVYRGDPIQIEKKKLACERFYLLDKEILPSKHSFRYFYDSRFTNLERIEARNFKGDKLYSFLDFAWDESTGNNLRYIHVTSSDHKRMEYCLGFYHEALSTQEVHSNFQPPENFHLNCPRTGMGPRVIAFNGPHGERFQVAYHPYTRKKRELEGDKVSTIKGPFGPNGEKITLASFSYKNNATEVLDAQGCRTVYAHDGEKLTHIIYCDEKNRCNAVQRFFWDGPNLRSKAMCDGMGIIMFAKSFFYKDGDVVEEVFSGSLTGERTTNILTNNKELMCREIGGITLLDLKLCRGDRISGGETYSKKYGYYSNHLLKTQTEEGGPTYEYSYKRGTDLLESKLTKDPEGRIYLRHFIFYDEDNFPVQEINDDGNSPSFDDLTGVTQRLEKSIVRNSESLPETVKESYWDPKTGSLHLLKKVKFTYENQKIVEEAVYDADDVYRYTLYTEYDSFGNVKRRTNPLGQENRYEYNSVGLLKWSKEVGSEEKVFSYDPAGRLISSVETGSGKTTSTAYHSKGYTLYQTDSRGNTTHYSYDAFGNRLSTSLPRTFDEKGEIFEPKLFCQYSNVGDLTGATEPYGKFTKTSYTSLRKPTSIIQADKTEIRHFYHKNGLIARTVYPDGTQEFYSYDFLQRLIKKEIKGKDGELLNEESFTYSAFQLLSHTDQKGLITHYYYDGAGRKVKEETEGRSISYTYDSLGFVERTDKGLESTVQKRNLLGLVEEQWEEDHLGVIENTTRFVYDQENRKCEGVRVTPQGEARDFFAYKEQKLVKHTDPHGASTEFIYDEVVNELQQKVSRKTVIDPLGNQTIETYDVGDRVSTIEKKDPSGKVVFKEKFLYDRLGNRAKRISYVEGKEVVISWKYDLMGRVVEENEGGKKIARFEYDVRGRLSKRILPSGIEISLAYDPLGRLLSQKSSDGAIHEEYCYGKGDDPIKIIDHIRGATIEREYNLFGEIVSETNGYGLTTRWRYDSLGRVVLMTLPDGSSIETVYEGVHVKTVERKGKEGTTLSRHRYTKFDCNGHVEEEELILGMGVVKTRHDLLERPLEQSSPYMIHSVSYGPSGLVVAKKNTLLGDKDYRYDSLNQLTKEGDETYEFDSLGNRVSHKVNDLNQVISTEDASFTYDPNGCLSQKTSLGETITYRFDPRGRLIEILYPEEKRIQYVYDPLSRLIAKEVSFYKEGVWNKGGLYYFLYDRDKEIGMVDEQGTILQLKVLGLGIKGDIGAAVAIEIQGVTYAPLHDFNGNIVALISSKRVVEKYDIDAFGKEYCSSPLNPWRFSSKRVDEGLVFFGLRFYDPSIGRWISPDPLGFADSANLYLYVHNAPLNRIDLFGLFSEDPFFQNPIYVPIPLLENCKLILCNANLEGVPVNYVVWSSNWHEIKFTPYETSQGQFNLFDHPEMVSHQGINLVTFRHGINFSHQDFMNSCKEITNQLPGGVFIGRYHGNDGFFTGVDLASKEILGFETSETISTAQFMTQCSQWLQKANPAVFSSSGALESLGSLWVHINHSRGGVIDRRAIEAMPNQQREILQTQLLLTAVAPAYPIPMEYGLGVINYYSNQDLFTGPLAMPERVLPLLGQVVGGKIGGLCGQFVSATYFNHNDCDIQFVPCVSKWSERTMGVDHSFLGGTYRGVVGKAIDDYQQRYTFYDGKTR